MNNIAFLQRVVESTNTPVVIVYDPPTSKVILSWNKQSWQSDTLDQCIAAMKETFAIMYLDAQEINKNQ